VQRADPSRAADSDDLLLHCIRTCCHAKSETQIVHDSPCNSVEWSVHTYTQYGIHAPDCPPLPVGPVRYPGQTYIWGRFFRGNNYNKEFQAMYTQELKKLLVLQLALVGQHAAHPS
jgi:hypothetical protein